ncbi:MAG: hypothetical protein LBN36_04450, partial [Clostridiales Family XIII bacterium]|nr:hypothetical protein [Clostridiales Family XIII bacterium]
GTIQKATLNATMTVIGNYVAAGDPATAKAYLEAQLAVTGTYAITDTTVRGLYAELIAVL